MTPLPKRRWSTRRQGKKRASFKGHSLKTSKCPNCGELKVSHTVCPSCGFYKGSQVLIIKNKETKARKARKES